MTLDELNEHEDDIDEEEERIFEQYRYKIIYCNHWRNDPKFSPFWTGGSGQTIKIQIRLKEKSDLGLHCLPIPVSLKIKDHFDID